LCCLALPLANTLDLLATNDPDLDEENEEDTPVYEKFDPLLHRDQGRNKRCYTQTGLIAVFLMNQLHLCLFIHLLEKKFFSDQYSFVKPMMSNH